MTVNVERVQVGVVLYVVMSTLVRLLLHSYRNQKHFLKHVREYYGTPGGKSFNDSDSRQVKELLRDPMTV